MAIVQGTITTLYGSTVTAALPASGTITFTGLPANNDTVTIGGAATTFKTSGAAASQINISATVAQMCDDLADFLNASVDAAIDDNVYVATATTVGIVSKTPGTGANAFTLAKSGANIAVSGATLAGGVASANTGQFQVVGTSIGEVLATRAGDTFEDNMIAVMALIQATLENTANPSTNDASITTCRYQRKVLKDIVQELSAAIKPQVGNTDTRVADAAKVRLRATSRFNGDTRPDAL